MLFHVIGWEHRYEKARANRRGACTTGKEVLFVSLGFLFFGTIAFAQPADVVFAAYKIRPVPSNGIIRVEARVQLQGRIPYIKDFGQIENVHWFIGKNEIAARSERLKDIVTFSGVPSSGEARVIYSIKVTSGFPIGANPGSLHFVGGRDYLYIAEGLFLGLNGAEAGLVDVQWELPPGWTLGLGRSGRQTFSDTQRRFWVAGRIKHATSLKIEGACLQLAIFDRPGSLNITRIEKSISSIFQYAWRQIGPLPGADFGLAVFPKGSLSQPGWFRYPYSLVDNVEHASPHEILHFWMNNNSPAWFREGVLEYMSQKFLIYVGILNDAALRIWLRVVLADRARLIPKTGVEKTLEESSAENDRDLRQGLDVYSLMPVLAYKLDKEIQRHAPNHKLDDVFIAVCRKRHQPVDILALIKEMTGYDPHPLFNKYFYAKIENAEELLK